MSGRPFASSTLDTGALPLDPLPSGGATATHERVDRTAGRLHALGVLFVVPLLVVAVRLAHVQLVLPPRFEEAWTATTERTEATPPRTGRLLAADGVVLAHDVPRLDLEMHYRWLESPPDPVWLARETLARLPRSERRDPARRAATRAELLGDRERLHDDLRALLGSARFDRKRTAIQARIDRMRRVVMAKRADRESVPPSVGDDRSWYAAVWEAFRDELTTPPHRSPDRFVLKEETTYHALLADVPSDVVTLIESAPQRFRGVRVNRRLRRQYPLGDTAAHVIGFRRASDDDRDATDPLAALPRGQAGLERSYDRQLAGQPGRDAVTFDWAGQEVARRSARDAIDGRDLTLTLHSRWQQDAETILDDAIETTEADGGVLLVVDCWSGAVRAAASGPRVDPNLYLTPDPQRWAAHQSDPRRPFFPRVHQMALPPGSTFKLLTAAAALESGFDPREAFYCRGYRSRPDRERCAVFVASGVGHGELRLNDAIARSCNVFFYDLADRLGHDRLADWAGRAGFGWTTGCDLPSEAGGRLPYEANPAAAASSRRQLAIGQGELTATPLQLARLAAAIANGGRLVRPHFAEGIKGADAAATSPEPWAGVSPQTLATLREAMRQTVTGGTASSLATLPVAVAGKTGTAENTGRSHAWFVGYFPADDPKFAVVSVLEHGGSGGRNAAPLVGRLVEAIAATPDWRDW